MKFFRVSALVLLVVLWGVVPVYAVESEGDAGASESAPVVDDSSQSENPTSETVVTENDKNITINVTVPPAPTIEAATPELVEEQPAPLELVPEPEPVYPAYSIITLDDSVVTSDSGFSGVVRSLFGVYSPRTQTVTEYLADGSSVTYQEYVPGVAGLDWHWLAGVILFSLVLWSFLRLTGVLLKR